MKTSDNSDEHANNAMPRSVAILGLGLMGGSLGLALRARGFAGRISGFARRAAVREQALRRGAVNEAHDDPLETVRGADAVAICVPVLTIPVLAEICAPALEETAAVTDVGSTKTWIVRSVRVALGTAANRFVGSHPIAGSERQGLDAADPDLYQGACVVLTPTDDTKAAAVKTIRALWQKAGARVVELSAEEHDRRLARTSHLPHVVASMLAAAVGRDGGAECGPFCGNGFRDTTRVADGSPELWRDIVRTNAAALLTEMEAFTERWEAFANALRREDYEEIGRLLERGRCGRRALLGESAPSSPRMDSA